MSATEESPFALNAPNSNPQCLPAAVKPAIVSNTPVIKALKPPKAPEKPLMPYMRYSRSVWDDVKASNKDSKLWEIGRIIGQLWRELSNADKQKYVDAWEIEKSVNPDHTKLLQSEYNEAMNAYQNSPAYQQYLLAKEKTRTDDANKAGSKSQNSNSKSVDSELVEENNTTDSSYLCLQRESGHRYTRNQSLMFECCSQVAVPDLRSIVTLPRMQMLKRQVQSLNMHQQKLETELAELEGKFQAKKRKIDTARFQFNESLKKLSNPAVDPNSYEQMVQKASDKLLSDYENYVRNTKVENDTNKAAVADREQPKEQVTPSQQPITAAPTVPTNNHVKDEVKLESI